jgi:hypothetical protein
MYFDQLLFAAIYFDQLLFAATYFDQLLFAAIYFDQLLFANITFNQLLLRCMLPDACMAWPQMSAPCKIYHNGSGITVHASSLAAQQHMTYSRHFT